MKRRLHLIVVVAVPLVLLSALCLYLTRSTERASLWPNLASGFIGTLFTVFYVDWVLRRHEQSEWVGLQRMLASQLESLITSTTNSLNEILGFEYQLKLWQIDKIERGEHLRFTMVMFTKMALEEKARAMLETISSEQWKKLREVLQATSSDIAAFIATFHGHLSAEVQEALIQSQHAAHEYIQRYDELWVVIDPDVRMMVAKSEVADELRKVLLDGFHKNLVALVGGFETVTMAAILK